MALVTLAVVEILVSAFFFYRYKTHIPELKTYSKSSLILFFQRAFRDFSTKVENRPRMKSDPSPLYVSDSIQGYGMKPGTYEISFFKLQEPKSKPFTYKATILNDGSRFVGTCRPDPSKDTPHVQVYGDSFIFGEGVNDEQTFSYLLQQAHPGSNIRLFAAGGYSLANAYIDFQSIQDKFNENDIIILGYADFYALRHVAAPSRIREFGKLKPSYSSSPKHLKFDIDAKGELTYRYVPLFCDQAGDYCSQKNPERPHMDSVSARIINEITKSTKAKVYLLYMRGDKEDPLLKLIDPSVTVVSALRDDFPNEVHDTVMDYDYHPGPYWHYAIFSLLNEAIYKYDPLGTIRPSATN